MTDLLHARPDTNVPPAGLRAAPPPPPVRARRRGGGLLVLALVAALGAAGCSGDDSSRVTPKGRDVIPKVCQDAREAFNVWVNADIEAFDAADNVVRDTIDLSIMVSDGASSEEITGLIDEVNAGVKVAEQKRAKSDQLYKAFAPSFDACLATEGALRVAACADEFGQYPAVTAARAKSGQAQVARLNEAVALRTALIAGDQPAVNAAVEQVTAAGDKVTATVDNWNNTVLPRYSTALKACNKAIA